jgi:hypothetical protein
MVKERAKFLALFVCKIDKPQAKAEWWRLVCDLAGKLKPLAIGHLQLEDEHFADLRLAQSVDVAATFRQVCNASAVVSALTVPNCVETNVPSFFGSAVAHLVSQRLLLWRLAFGSVAG